MAALGIPVVFVEALGAEGAYLVDASAATLPRLDLAPDEAALPWTAGHAFSAGPQPSARISLTVFQFLVVPGTP